MNIKQLIEKLKQFDENLPVCVADDTEIFELDEFYGFDVFEGEYTAVRTDRKMIPLFSSGTFLVLNNIGDTDLEQSDFRFVE